MKHNCPTCGKPMLQKTSNYHYKESGLDNVFLENVTVYKCSCGITYPSIFRVPRLHALIAERLLEKPALLEGEEIRFLRKTLSMSSKGFSEALGVGLTTYSKWENNRQQHSAPNDRAIRAMYIILKGIQAPEAKEILKNLALTRHGKPDRGFVIVAEKVDDDYVTNWNLVTESMAEESIRVWVTSGVTSRTTAQHPVFVANYPNIMYGSVPINNELIQTGTSSYAFDFREGDIYHGAEKAQI